MPFKKGEYYIVDGIHSVFQPSDYITIQNKNNTSLYRFALKDSTGFYVEDYLGFNEEFFNNYFCDLKEERKNKLKTISKIDS